MRINEINSRVLAFFYFPYCVFSEQSTLFGLYLNSWTTKNHEKILDNSTLQYLSLSARMSLISILVMEIRKSQGNTSVLFGIQNSFFCALFSTKKTKEFGKVFYKEVVENFISFPTV